MIVIALRPLLASRASSSCSSMSLPMSTISTGVMSAPPCALWLPFNRILGDCVVTSRTCSAQLLHNLTTVAVDRQRRERSVDQRQVRRYMTNLHVEDDRE